jgi:hypothetical protein
LRIETLNKNQFTRERASRVAAAAALTLPFACRPTATPATEGINVMSDNTLDLDQAQTEIRTGAVSDEALEAATWMDQRPRGLPTFAPIWCPGSAGRPA